MGNAFSSRRLLLPAPPPRACPPSSARPPPRPAPAPAPAAPLRACPPSSPRSPPRPRPPPRPVLRETPWRKTLGWGQSARNQLRVKVLSLHPETNLDVTSFNILLLGQIAAGKSSFINSIHSVLHDRICAAIAQAGRMGTSVTTELYIHEMSPSIRIYDTMGINADALELDLFDILQAIDGHVPHGYTFTPGKEFHDNSLGYIARPSLAQRVHCVAMVINAQCVSQMKCTMRLKLQMLASGLFSRKIRFFIILTHMDEFCEEVQIDITNIYRSFAVESLVNKISTMVHGLPENQIFPVINYSRHVELDDNMDILLLYALRQMLTDSQDHLKRLERDHEPIFEVEG